MKKYWTLGIPFFVPIVFGIAYSPFNRSFLVERFGCGCNFDGINANHITSWIFLTLLAFCIILFLFLSRKLSGWKRWIFFAAATLVQLLITNFMMMREIWL